MYERFKPNVVIKKIDQLFINKYLGFSFYELDYYILSGLKSLKYTLFNNNLENIIIKINQKNLYNLELQRKSKIEGLTQKFEKFSLAILSNNNNEYDIKLRVKGDRALHWYDKDQTSYRIDLRGENRIWGLEEFSVQKPVTRNYIYEYIFHKYLEFHNLISLKYFFVNLSVNDTQQGIYAVEEGFSKELIERNKKRNGPIFGLEEKKSSSYPNIEYDLYSNNYWQTNHSDLIESAKEKLKKLKINQIEIKEIFDLEKWATYFAVIDLTGTFHGSIPKSVKLYYNPTTAKFEPIGFDGHYNDNLFKDFLIIDFLDLKNDNCSFICEEREWYFRFFKREDGNINEEFLSLYLEKLKEIASQKSINRFYELNLEKINFFNDQFLSEVSNKDRGLYKGLGFYIFNKNYLFERSNYIQKRISKIEESYTKIKIIEENNLKRTDLLKKNEIKKDKGNFKLSENLEINKNFYLAKDKFLTIDKGVKIFFEKDVSILSEGSISFNGTREEPIIIYSDNGIGSLILSNNVFKLNNVIFKNLSYPKDKNKILYGGINIINSNVEIIDTEIIASKSEDAINLISSNSIIDNLKVKNISADGIDVDFGSLKFKNIFCENIDNDCLDVSGANIDGTFLIGKNIKDKGISFGENADGKISNINFENSKLGIAVKDGSVLKVLKYELKNNEYDVAVFNKKKEYKGASLFLMDSLNDTDLKYLIGFNNQITQDENILSKKIDNKIINELFY